MRAWSLAAAACAAFSLTACERPAPSLERRADSQPAVAERVSVLSGDTFVIDGRHVRLANVFAPEPIPRARCWSEALAAKLAARLVQQMMRDASSIEIKPTGERDIYNREIAFVTLGGLDLGQSLYDEGLAAKTGLKRFPWCDPISQKVDGEPTIYSLMELKPR